MGITTKKDNKEQKKSDKPKEEKKSTRDVFFTLPGTPARDGNVAINVPQYEGSKVVGNKEVSLKIVKGAVRVEGKRPDKERLPFIKMLIDAGMIQVKDDNVSSLDSSVVVVHEYTLLHPDVDKTDEPTSEYKIQYTDAGEPVEVKLLVKLGIIKTTNRKWSDLLVGLGFRLDKDHIIK